MVEFNQIPSGLLVPGVYVEFDASQAQQGPALQTFRALLVGQRRTGVGTVAELVPTRITSADRAAQAFGEGSQLHGMAQAWFAQNRTTELWACALDDPAGGTAAEGTITFGGDPTEAGTVYLYVAGRRVPVAVAADDTPADVATATVAAITAAAGLPVTAAVNGVTTEQVDITARHAGLAGNELDLRLDYYAGEAGPAGLTVAIVDVGTAVAGAGALDFDEVWTVLGDEQYHVIAFPSTATADLVSVETELADRWGPLRAIPGIAFAASQGDHTALVTLGEARNSPHVSIMASTGSPMPPWEWAAAVAGLVAFQGQQDPALPFQHRALEWPLSPAVEDRFTNFPERNLLLAAGIATHYVTTDGGVRVQRLVTTYGQNEFGADDTAFRDVTTPLIAMYVRFDLRNYWIARYSSHKLAGDAARFAPGQRVMTPSLARAECVNLFRRWEELGLVEDIDQFKRDLVVEIDAQDPNQLNILFPPNFVNQLRQTKVKVEFRL